MVKNKNKLLEYCQCADCRIVAIKAKDEILKELILIFEKYKDEPMTGNVVILELKVRLSKFMSQN